jgi:hypothetical protein
MSDDLRHRFRVSKKAASTSSEESIFGIWAEQNRMQAEEDKMARELAETKKKAKELSKTLRAHRYGEIKADSIKKVEHHKKKLIESVTSMVSLTKKWAIGHRKPAIGISIVAIMLVSFAGYTIFKPDTTATLGDSTTNTALSKDLPVEKPVFSLLFRPSTAETDFDVKRTNPEGSAPTYTYLDSFTDADLKFQVSQQKVPENFNLEKTANDFQATDIIQIDGDKVYHGLSDKTKTQSLLFVKKDRLLLISSPQKFTDDQWAAYIISLN